MFTSKYKAIIIAASMAVFSDAAAQDPEIVSRNTKYMDSVERSIKNLICNYSLTYPIYKKAKFKDDLVILSVLNDLFDTAFISSRVRDEVRKIKRARIDNTEITNGLLKMIHLNIRGNYFRADLTLDCIDEYIIRKKCLIYPAMSARCGKYGQRVIDLRLIKDILAKRINFLIGIVDREYLVGNQFSRISLDNASKIHHGYEFNLSVLEHDDSGRLRQIILNQFNSDSTDNYSQRYPDKMVAELLENDRLDVLKSMVYSPNYHYAINAMEAIVFLAHINRVVLDTALILRIGWLRGQRFPVIVKRSYDSFEVVDDYAELKMSDDRIFKKYQTAPR